MALFSASASRGFHSFFLTMFVKRSVSAGSFSKASLNLFSAASSVETSSMAFSGQAFTHWASSQNLQARAKLNSGVMRMTRILDFNGFPRDSPFSSAQAYSQIPQPVHLLGSTETNFL